MMAIPSCASLSLSPPLPPPSVSFFLPSEVAWKTSKSENQYPGQAAGIIHSALLATIRLLINELTWLASDLPSLTATLKFHCPARHILCFVIYRRRRMKMENRMRRDAYQLQHLLVRVLFDFCAALPSQTATRFHGNLAWVKESGNRSITFAL